MKKTYMLLLSSATLLQMSSITVANETRLQSKGKSSSLFRDKDHRNDLNNDSQKVINEALTHWNSAAAQIGTNANLLALLWQDCHEYYLKIKALMEKSSLQKFLEQLQRESQYLQSSFDKLVTQDPIPQPSAIATIEELNQSFEKKQEKIAELKKVLAKAKPHNFLPIDADYAFNELSNKKSAFLILLESIPNPWLSIYANLRAQQELLSSIEVSQKSVAEKYNIVERLFNDDSKNSYQKTVQKIQELKEISEKEISEIAAQHVFFAEKIALATQSYKAIEQYQHQLPEARSAYFKSINNFYSSHSKEFWNEATNKAILESFEKIIQREDSSIEKENISVQKICSNYREKINVYQNQQKAAQILIETFSEAKNHQTATDIENLITEIQKIKDNILQGKDQFLKKQHALEAEQSAHFSELQKKELELYETTYRESLSQLASLQQHIMQQAALEGAFIFNKERIEKEQHQIIMQIKKMKDQQEQEVLLVKERKEQEALIQEEISTIKKLSEQFLQGLFSIKIAEKEKEMLQQHLIDVSQKIYELEQINEAGERFFIEQQFVNEKNRIEQEALLKEFKTLYEGELQASMNDLAAIELAKKSDKNRATQDQSIRESKEQLAQQYDQLRKIQEKKEQEEFLLLQKEREKDLHAVKEASQRNTLLQDELQELQNIELALQQSLEHATMSDKERANFKALLQQQSIAFERLKLSEYALQEKNNAYLSMNEEYAALLELQNKDKDKIAIKVAKREEQERIETQNRDTLQYLPGANLSDTATLAPTEKEQLAYTSAVQQESLRKNSVETMQQEYKKALAALSELQNNAIKELQELEHEEEKNNFIIATWNEKETKAQEQIDFMKQQVALFLEECKRLKLEEAERGQLITLLSQQSTLIRSIEEENEALEREVLAKQFTNEQHIIMQEAFFKKVMNAYSEQMKIYEKELEMIQGLEVADKAVQEQHSKIVEEATNRLAVAEQEQKDLENRIKEEAVHKEEIINRQAIIDQALIELKQIEQNMLFELKSLDITEEQQSIFLQLLQEQKDAYQQLLFEQNTLKEQTQKYFSFEKELEELIKTEKAKIKAKEEQIEKERNIKHGFDNLPGAGLNKHESLVLTEEELPHDKTSLSKKGSYKRTRYSKSAKHRRLHPDAGIMAIKALELATSLPPHPVVQALELARTLKSL